MKKLLFTFCICVLANISFSQEKLKTVFGTVTDDFGVLRDVNISIQGKDEKSATNENGKYSISAIEGDILVFSQMGMLPLEIKVEDVTRVLNIKMYEKVEKLNEVTVTKKILKNQNELAIEYNSNPNLIKTSWGILDKETSTFSLRILDEKALNRAIDLGTALNARFAGVTTNCDNGDLAVSVRTNGGIGGAGSDGAIFDVDGQIFTSLPCHMIDPNNILRIAVIPSFSGTLRYGSIARGGVVVINTKTANYRPKDENGQIIDVVRRQDNKYQNDALHDEAKANTPVYLEEYYLADSESRALQVYDNLVPKYAHSFFFILDTYNYFISAWKNHEIANLIVRDNWQVFEENPVALKSLAYLYQVNDEHSKANEIFKKIFRQRPQYAQSYLDLAKSYIDNNEHQKGAGIYTRYGYLLEEGFLKDSIKDFALLMDRELNNLIALNGKDFLSKKDLKKLTLEEYFEGTRLIFEWADSEAEFELQFVNPQNRYFSWSHSLRDNPERIKNEKSAGFSTEEYLIDGSLKGIWQVNIKYLGNKSLTPTYLKATIYYNYGSNSQRKETKVFKLSLMNVNQQLFSVNTEDVVVSK